MKKLLCKIILSAIILCFINSSGNSAEIQKFKLGTLAPKGTSATMSFDMLNALLGHLEGPLGARIITIGYYGGVMGDDPQMIQKCKTGQLDMIATTVTGLSLMAKEIEAYNMALLIENFGQFDYIMTKTSVDINNLFDKYGWVSLSLITSEGQHDLYMEKPYRTADEMRKNLKAANYTGGPDETFYKAVGIPESPISSTEMFPAFRTKVSNTGIIPSAFVIGMQIYTIMQYIVEPPIRLATSAIVLRKDRYNKMPWSYKVYIAVMQPIMYHFGAGIMRDAAYAYSDAMLNYGVKKIKLTDEEFKTLQTPVAAYRNTYLNKNKSMIHYYNNIVKYKAEYNSKDTVEKSIYMDDPRYKTFPDKIKKILKALRSFYTTGDKSIIARLENDKVIERWRLYDWINACEQLIKTNNMKPLETWLKSFYTTEMANEIFSNHTDTVKQLYGSQKEFRKRVEEIIYFYDLCDKQYSGFQKSIKKRQ